MDASWSKSHIPFERCIALYAIKFANSTVWKWEVLLH